jgi:hypothetical protein
VTLGKQTQPLREAKIKSVIDIMIVAGRSDRIDVSNRRHISNEPEMPAGLVPGVDPPATTDPTHLDDLAALSPSLILGRLSACWRLRLGQPRHYVDAIGQAVQKLLLGVVNAEVVDCPPAP